MSLSLKICIANVSGLNFQVIKLSKEHHKVESSQGDNTRVDTFKWNFSQVSISNQAAFMASIMLNIKNKVNLDPFITMRQFGSLSKVLEGLVIMELIHLKHGRILPLCVAIPLVKFNSMIEVFGNFISMVLSDRIAT